MSWCLDIWLYMSKGHYNILEDPVKSDTPGIVDKAHEHEHEHAYA